MLTRILISWRTMGWIRGVICLPLLLALWNAPLPWVHRHEETEAADTELAEHLRMFHHERHQDHDAQEWHWHFALLWQMMGCEEFPPSDQPTHCVLITGDDCPCPGVSDLSARDVMARLLTPGANPATREFRADPRRTPGCIAAERSRRFLHTFLVGATLRDLLCTARC